MAEMKCSGKMHPGGEGSSGMEPMIMMARGHHAQYRWVQAVIAVLALWLISSPITFGYRSAALRWSDVASGVLMLAIAGGALGKNRGLVSWMNSFVGLWLIFAPLVLWAPDAAAYANDTLVGALLIAFSLVIPMGMEMEGGSIPPGWSYNPSSWPQRAPIIALAVLSFFAARYMAAEQLGYIAHVWDPFFGAQTDKVLHSKVSSMWPVSDAGLGAGMYLIEILSGFMGDRRRWRTMPWMVAMFGVVVIPLGIVSIVLVILQPLSVGAWCSPCLFSAALMLLMIPLSLDEVVAMIQFVAHEKRKGRSAWRTFWLGGNQPETAPDKSERASSWTVPGMIWGCTATRSLWLVTALGLWLMFAPDRFAATGGQADSDHLAGALVVVFAVIAFAEIARPVRYLNLALGAWLLGSSFVLGGGTTLAHIDSAVVGALIAALSLPTGAVRERYGTLDKLPKWRLLRAPAH